MGKERERQLANLRSQKEFENILVARHVVPKLNDLESLISDATRRREETTSEAIPTPYVPPNHPPNPQTTPPNSSVTFTNNNSPHVHPPPTILTAHLTPSLIAHQSQLNARLQTTQSQNALLFDEVQRQREEIEALLRRLEGVVADVKGANEALGEVVGDVVREALEGETVK